MLTATDNKQYRSTIMQQNAVSQRPSDAKKVATNKLSSQRVK